MPVEAPTPAPRLSSRLAPSTWSYLAWGTVYVALWLCPALGVPVPRVFADILVSDFFVNLVTPFVVGGVLVILSVMPGRPRLPWLAWPLLAGLALACVLLPLQLLFEAGGWLLLATTLLLFSRAGWLFQARGDTSGVLVLFARGLFGPWVFGLPALVLSCLWTGRDTLGFEQTDWVPLFGAVYFGLQAGFEELAVRRSRAPGR